MDTEAGSRHVIVGFDILDASGFQHFNCTVFHVYPHFHFVLLELTVNIEGWQAIFVFFILVECSLVLIIRKMFAPRAPSHGPVAWFGNGFLEFDADFAGTGSAP